MQSKWQQVSWGLQDSSKYPNWSELCDSSFDLQFLQSLFHAFGDGSNCDFYIAILETI